MLVPYKTVKKNSEVEIIINKSRFIGRAFPVSSEEDALEILAKIRRQHYDATHNCYAYVIKDGAARFSDDGEPSGTAGMPMMEVLKAKELVNVLVIVTRYFGGILLGAGGLVRAYSRSTSEAVTCALPVSVLPGSMYRIVTDYSRYNAIADFLRERTELTDVSYAENVTVTYVIDSTLAEGFTHELIEKTDGRIIPEFLGEEYMHVEDKNA